MIALHTLLPLFAAACQATPAPPPLLQATDGPLGQLVSAVQSGLGGAVSAQASPPIAPSPWPEWPGSADQGWHTDAPWLLWAARVRAATGEVPATALPARQDLALLALAQGRHGDAWGHLAACGAEPARVRALLPHFMPGPDAASGILAPALPPPGEGRRMLVARGVTAAGPEGNTTFDLLVYLEPDGIQVDLDHRSGPPLEVTVTLPIPPELVIGVAYVDWFRTDDARAPARVRLAAGDETHTIWGRFKRIRRDWPSGRPSTTATGLFPGGIQVAAPAGSQPLALGRGIAAGLRHLLGLEEQGRTGFEPLVLHLDDSAQALRTLPALLSLAEAHALGHDPTDGRRLGPGRTGG